MSYSLKSLKGGCRDYLEDYCRVLKGDTRSLDNSSYAQTEASDSEGFSDPHPVAAWFIVET